MLQNDNLAKAQPVSLNLVADEQPIVSPMEKLRASLPTITLAQPAVARKRLELLAALPAYISDALRESLQLPTWAIRAEAQLRHRSVLLQEFEPAGAMPITTVLDMSTEESHDRFFGVTRSEENVAMRYVNSVLKAHHGLRANLARLGSNVEMQALKDLDGGLKSCLGLMLGLSATGGDDLSIGNGRATPFAVAQRWIYGHHVFAVLSQGLIMGFSTLADAMRDCDSELANLAADHIICLMNASAASLRFTGDFSPEFYEELIRPSMAPPFMSDSFSGLLSKDHRLLVRCMKEGKASIDLFKLSNPDKHRAIYSALSGVYDAHKCVCNQFVGSETSSLVQTGSQCASAGEQLDRFKDNRLKMIDQRGP